MKYSKPIKKFLKMNLLFWSPILLFWIFLSFFSIYSGEVTTLNNVIEKQSNRQDDYLFGREVINRETIKYKYSSLIAKNPDILVVGSSRVMQFREEMFGGDNTFYNAGGLVGNIQDLLDFIKILPEDNQPKIILLGLDSWWFDVNSRGQQELLTELSKKDEFYNWKAHLYANRFLFKKMFSDSSLFFKIIKGRDSFSGQLALGLSAISDGTAFRDDGSRQYSNHLRLLREDLTYVDRESPPVIIRIKNGLAPFYFDSRFDESSLEKLEEFLIIAKRRGIEVIGIAPPFSSEVRREINDSYYTVFFKDFTVKISSLFSDQNLGFYDFFNFPNLELDDQYMYDGFHVSETGAAYMLLSILEDKCTIDSDWIDNCDEVMFNLVSKLEEDTTTPAEILW